MQMNTIGRLAILVLLLGMVRSISAGPSFNSDREGLARMSQEAGAELHRGFSQFHEMLRCLELREQSCINEQRQKALTSFDSAVAAFEKVALSAPNQRLVLSPATDEEKQAIENFRRRLKDQTILFPETEKALASIAVELVRTHASLLRDANFKGTKADYPMLRRVLSSQGTVLDIGILASIAWSVSTPSG